MGKCTIFTKKFPIRKMNYTTLDYHYIKLIFELISVNTTGKGSDMCNAVTSGTMNSFQGNDQYYDQGASSVVMSNTTSQYCPRHHHHTPQSQPQNQQNQQQQNQQQRQTPSPNKRHRLTPRPHNIQRPCLDFEKMQQVIHF